MKAKDVKITIEVHGLVLEVIPDGPHALKAHLTTEKNVKNLDLDQIEDITDAFTFVRKLFR